MRMDDLLSAFKPPHRLTIAVITASLAGAGCGGGSNDDPGSMPGVTPDAGAPVSPDSGPSGPVELTGAIQKGPFAVGSTVTVAGLDPVTTNPSGQVFPASTRNDLGEFNLTVPAAGVFEIQTTGFYFNELDNRTSTAQISIRAVVELQAGSSQQAYVNALTHLTHLRTKKLVRDDALSFADAIAQAETEIRNALPLATSLSVAAGTELNVLGGDSDDNAYLFALGCSLMQAALNEQDGAVDAALQTLMNRVALDLEDNGTLEADLTDQLDRGARFLDPDKCTENMASFIDSNGSDATVPDIHRALDFDRDGLGNQIDPDADGDEILADDDNIIAFAAGEFGGGSAVDAAGQVWVWGGGGPLSPTGCDIYIRPCPPLVVPGVNDVIDVAMIGGGNDPSLGGGSHLALLSDRTLVYWSGFDVHQPTPVPSIDSVTALSKGRSLLFTRDDGTAWTINQDGTAEQLIGISNARYIIRDTSQSIYWVLQQDGTVLGYRTDFSQTHPIDGLDDVVAISIGGQDSHSGWAVDSDGQLWNWSPFDARQNGTDTAETVTTRTAVASLAPRGSFFSLTDGTVWRFLFDAGVEEVAGYSDVVQITREYYLGSDGNLATFTTNGQSEPVRIPR